MLHAAVLNFPWQTVCCGHFGQFWTDCQCVFCMGTQRFQISAKQTVRRFHSFVMTFSFLTLLSSFLLKKDCRNCNASCPIDVPRECVEGIITIPALAENAGSTCEHVFCVLRWFNLPKFECMDAAMNSTVMGVARSLRTAGLCKVALWPRNRRLDVWEC